MNLYKYILSILFPVVLSVLTFSCKEEAGIELFQNLDIVGEVPIQEGSLRCTVLHGGTINVYGGVGKYDVFSSDEETVQVEMVENRYMRFYALKSGQATLTVMDDAHNASEIRISIEPYLRNIWLYEVGYQVTADNEELRTCIEEELAVSETWRDARLQLLFDTSEGGSCQIYSGNSALTDEGTRFTWTPEGVTVISPEGNELYLSRSEDFLLPENIRKSRALGPVHGAWEMDLTEEFRTKYPSVKSVRKILFYTYSAD